MEKGFSLIELLITLGIIAILSVTTYGSLGASIEQTKYNKTAQTKLVLAKASQLYWIDMGFYPPDVNRGWDPGFMRQDPWNTDIEDGEVLPGWAQTADIDCSHCPDDWEDILDQRWNGPYLTKWPDETEWGGEYDYNYWPEVTERNGCDVPPGIYAGALRDYNDTPSTQMSSESEQAMLDLGLDDDFCLNSETQLLLHSL